MAETRSDLLLEDISRRFGTVQALDRTSLHIQQGEMMSLLGPSGCGKTTTLRIIAGFETPDTGRVCIGGRDLAGLPPNRRQLGMVAQDYSLFPHMTVGANVAFGLRMARRPDTEVGERVTKMLKLVQLSGYEERYPHQLSGGQQQRVALARALVTNPSVLLLDEPLAALDKNLREAMQFELRRIQQTLGITTVMVTHDQEEALTLSDRIAVMNEGRILQVGKPREIYESPRTRFVSQFIGTANLLEGKVLEIEADGMARVGLGAEVVTIRVANTVDVGNTPTVGKTLTFGLRPEKLRLLASPAAIGNVLKVQITGHVFRGTYHAYETAVTGVAQPVLVYQQSISRGGDHVHERGETVWMAWHPAEAIVFEQDPS